MNFGYSISQSSKIDMDETSRDIAEQILRYEPSSAACIGCGTCMVTCSAGRFTSLNLRHLMLMMRRGQTNQLYVEAEKCMLCGKCQMLCPRGVNTRNVILAIHKYSKIP